MFFSTLILLKLMIWNLVSSGKVRKVTSSLCLIISCLWRKAEQCNKKANIFRTSLLNITNMKEVCLYKYIMPGRTSMLWGRQDSWEREIVFDWPWARRLTKTDCSAARVDILLSFQGGGGRYGSGKWKGKWGEEWNRKINQEYIGADIFIEGQAYLMTEYTAMRIMRINDCDDGERWEW